MGTRVGRSYSALVTALQQAIAGALEHPEDPVQVDFAKQLTKELEDLIAANEKQEKAKAALYGSTQRVLEIQKTSRQSLSRLVSYLESKHGKTGAELQNYGITRRQPSGKQSSKKSPDKPK